MADILEQTDEDLRQESTYEFQILLKIAELNKEVALLRQETNAQNADARKDIAHLDERVAHLDERVELLRQENNAQSVQIADVRKDIELLRKDIAHINERIVQTNERILVTERRADKRLAFMQWSIGIGFTLMGLLITFTRYYPAISAAIGG